MNFIKKNDFLLLASLLIIAAVFMLINYFNSRNLSQKEYVVYVGGAVAATGSLSVGESEFAVDAMPSILFGTKDNSVAFLISDCPDKICVKTGFIGIAGQTAACLPNNTVLLVRGAKRAYEADAVVSVSP